MKLTVNHDFYFMATVREFKISHVEFNISRRVHSCLRNFHPRCEKIYDFHSGSQSVSHSQQFFSELLSPR